MARSKERQQSAAYFAKAKEDNARGKQEIEDQERIKAEAAAAADEAEEGGEADESSTPEAEVEDDDPFALGKRLKVHSN